jgi:hypothetical protein
MGLFKPVLKSIWITQTIACFIVVEQATGNALFFLSLLKVGSQVAILHLLEYTSLLWGM